MHTRDPITTMLLRPDMSRRAKGLLLEMLASDDADLTTQKIIDAGSDGKAAVAAMLTELESLGYVRREQARNGNLFGTVRLIATTIPEEGTR